MYLTNGTLLQGGKYRIERHISSGGFGNTYEGLDVSLNKRVAIKEFFVKDFCSRDSETTLVTVTVSTKAPLIEHLKRKFMDEARAIANMEHENIVKVQALFEENGTAYYVMDFIDGESVGDLLKRRGSLPESEALSIIRKVASALDYMHKQNRYHLDVKPANIMLRRDGKVILIDFGSSKQYAEVDGENTTTFAPCYTPGYAPSEQMNPAHTTFTAATDIYALGATLYKILTGVTPPSAISLMNGEDTLSSLPIEVSSQVKVCVEKAMIPQRNLRLQSIEEWEILLKADEHTLTASDIGQSFTEETLVIKDAAENMVEKGLALYNEGYYDSALEHWHKPAEQGSAEALYHIGVCHAKGKGVPEDTEKAVEWYRKAAEQGCGEAMFNLGQHYEDDDYIEAVKWYQEAEKHGCKEGAQEAKRALLKAEAGKLQPWYIRYLRDNVFVLFLLYGYVLIVGICIVIGFNHWDRVKYDEKMLHIVMTTIYILLIILVVYKVIAYNRRAEEYKSKHPDDPVNEYL